MIEYVLVSVLYSFMQRAVAINLLSDSQFPYNFVKGEKKKKEKMVMSYMRL